MWEHNYGRQLLEKNCLDKSQGDSQHTPSVAEIDLQRLFLDRGSERLKGQGKPSTVKKVSSCQSMCGIAHEFSQLHLTEETRYSMEHFMFFCTLRLCTHLA